MSSEPGVMPILLPNICTPLQLALLCAAQQPGEGLVVRDLERQHTQDWSSWVALNYF